MTLYFRLLLLIMLIVQIRSVVCLSLTRTCREMARLSQQRSSPGGCWASLIMAVPDVSCHWNNFTPCEVYASVRSSGRSHGWHQDVLMAGIRTYSWLASERSHGWHQDVLMAGIRTSYSFNAFLPTLRWWFTWMWYLSVPTNSETHSGWMCWS